MAKYIFKRVLRSLVTMIIVIIIVFSLLRPMPIEGNYENFDKLSDTQIEVRLNELGDSIKYRKNVAITTIIAEKIPISLFIGLTSLAIALALGLPLGILMARSTRTLWKLWDLFGTVFIVFIESVHSASYYFLIELSC